MESREPYGLFGIECGPGWSSLYEPIVRATEECGASVFQIKEKFGALRIYVDGAPEWLQQIINNTERLSMHVCEECGAEGYLRSGPWLRTLCDECDRGKS